MAEVTLHDKRFAPYISTEVILNNIEQVAQQINADFHGQEVVFIGVLNGAFRFVSELMHHIDLSCHVSFIKLSSYQGTSSTEEVKELIGFNESLENKNVIVIEDIIDTGNTLETIMNELDSMNPKSIKVGTLLYKPEAYTKSIPVDYIGIEIPNDFIVGFGLDYDGLGRNLNDIYKIVE